MLSVNRMLASKRGFTLIEIVFALVIFSILILTFAASVPFAWKSMGINGQHAQALSLCQHKIDGLRAVGYGRLNYAELLAAEIIDASPNVSPYSFLTRDSVASYLPNPSEAKIIVQSLPPDKYKVTVMITWKHTSYRSTESGSTATITAYIYNVE